MTHEPADSLHRLMKQLLDAGVAKSVADAAAIFAGYRITFVVGYDAARNRHDQAALLTGVALASRVFLGGVTVAGNLDVPLLLPLRLGSTLDEAVYRLGARRGDGAGPNDPCVFFGGARRARAKGFEIRPVYSGWRAGIVPAHGEFDAGEGFVMEIAPMLAAALAISEAFFYVQEEVKIAGRRAIGLSLWDLSKADWQSPDSAAPPVRYLPSKLWLIGLGHLGQAYLWALSLLPYASRAEATLVLQDVDVVTPSALSTSVLSVTNGIGQKKTRLCAEWAELLGFSTIITERFFDELCKRAAHEPGVAMCGLDNALGRLALDGAGFDFVVEAGLGRGYRDFRTMRLHTLPGSRPASAIWASPSQQEDVTDRVAYRQLLKSGELDQCGVTLLAGKAVGAPFVGAVAACLAVSELLRLLHGGVVHDLIDVDLHSLEHRQAIRSPRDFATLNPGFVMVKARDE